MKTILAISIGMTISYVRANVAQADLFSLGMEGLAQQTSPTSSTGWYRAQVVDGVFSWTSREGTPPPSWDTDRCALTGLASCSYALITTSSDLSAGEIKIYAEACDTSVAACWVDLHDTLFLDWGLHTDPFDVAIDMTLTGTKTASADDADVSFYVLGGNSPEGTEGFADTFGSIDINIPLTVTMDPSSDPENLAIYALVRLDGISNGIVDLRNTARISLALPEGVTYTSASGVFLTSNPVPEPSTMLLLGSGLLGMGVMWFVRRVMRHFDRRPCSVATSLPSDRI